MGSYEPDPEGRIGIADVKDSYFKYAIGIILFLLIVLLLYHTSPVFSPILAFVVAIFLPILFSTFLYYILRPIVYFLDRWLPRYISIIIVYIVVTVLVTLVFIRYYPEVMTAISEISPERVETFKKKLTQMLNNIISHIPFIDISSIESVVLNYFSSINSFIYHMSVNLISTIAGITISLALTPFVLYYFLRDDSLFSKYVVRYVPVDFQNEVERILHDIDVTLSSFIITQVTLAGAVGFFLLCGYFIIELPHPVSLALFGMIFYVIPFLGTFIAIIPALIIALSISIGMTLKVILVMFIAHFIDANILTPRLMSNSLNIHPLTIILLLLAAGSLYGILGLLLVTPTYAILKVLVWNLYKITKLHYAKTKHKRVSDLPP